MSLKARAWKLAFASWGRCTPADQPGYSLLVPVPGDLPVFLQLALAVLRKQYPKDRVETLVIPDVCTPRVRAIVAQEAATWHGPLKLVELPLPDRLIPKWMNRPHHNHWLQLINGARQARGRHALLHDADLFIENPNLLHDQYQRCVAGGYSCFGVNRVWDEWFARHGLHLTATWEMFFDVAWLRSFPPHQHLGHDDVWNGEPHTFDTTLFPQSQTPGHKIAWHTPASGLVHFNYVICSYRYFRDARGPYADDNFRVLLIRLLVDLFDPAGDDPHLPFVTDLVRGLSDASAKVHYTSAAAASNYAEFRGKLAELLAGELLSPGQRDLTASAVAPFDAHFGWKNAR